MLSHVTCTESEAILLVEDRKGNVSRAYMWGKGKSFFHVIYDIQWKSFHDRKFHISSDTKFFRAHRRSRVNSIATFYVCDEICFCINEREFRYDFSVAGLSVKRDREEREMMHSSMYILQYLHSTQIDELR